MKFFYRFIVVLIFIYFFGFITIKAFADTTNFNSASIVTTNGSPLYVNLTNCSLTDGQTCDRAQASSYSNLFFRSFGDFGIPAGSSVTNVRLRVTGKTSVAIYAGVSLGTSYGSNCQTPSNLWTMSSLNSPTIATYSVTTSISGGLASCFSLSNILSNNFIFRINYSSGQSWSANIDNFEIAFDYIAPILAPTNTPTPSPTSTPTPTPTPTNTPTPSPTSTPTPTSVPTSIPTPTTTSSITSLTSTPTPTPTLTPTITPKPISTPTPISTQSPAPTQDAITSVLSSQDVSLVKSNSSSIDYEIDKETEDGSEESCIGYSGNFLKLLFCLVMSLIR